MKLFVPFKANVSGITRALIGASLLALPGFFQGCAPELLERPFVLNLTGADGVAFEGTQYDYSVSGGIGPYIFSLVQAPGYYSNSYSTSSSSFNAPAGGGGLYTRIQIVDALGRSGYTSFRYRPQIVAGATFSCGFKGTSTSLKCWGSNAYGQLGLGTAVNHGDSAVAGHEMGSLLPAVDLGSGRTIYSFQAGQLSMCAILDDYSVKCWGTNSLGQLGIGDVTGANAKIGDTSGETGSGIAVTNLGTGVLAYALAGGTQFMCALTSLGKVKCWGDNNACQLGHDLLNTDAVGDGTGSYPIPASVGYVNLGSDASGATYTAKAVAAGDRHVCVILNDGNVKCWGNGGVGQLGNGVAGVRGCNTSLMSGASIVDLGTGRTAVQLALGTNHTCALLDNQRVKCWGDNTYGQLGLGTTTRHGDSAAAGHEMGDLLSYVDLGTDSSGATYKAKLITSGSQHMCALLTDGKVRCWGCNDTVCGTTTRAGMLGTGDTIRYGDGLGGGMGNSLPFVDLGTGRTAIVIRSGGQASHTCAYLDNGATKCWGDNQYGQLGIGDITGNNLNMGDQAGDMGDNLPAVSL